MLYWYCQHLTANQSFYWKERSQKILLIAVLSVVYSTYLPARLSINLLDSLAEKVPITSNRMDLFLVKSSTWLTNQSKNSSILTAAKGELIPMQLHLENLKSNIEDLKTRDWINKFFLLALCGLLLLKTDFISSLIEEWQKNRDNKRQLKMPPSSNALLIPPDRKSIRKSSLELDNNESIPFLASAIVRTNLELLPEEEIWLNTLQQTVRKNLDNIHFDITQLADELAISRRHLNRKARQCTGLSTAKYIQETRLLKAKAILEEQQVTAVKVVAYEVGFKDVKYFGQLYKKRFGRLPSSYL